MFTLAIKSRMRFCSLLTLLFVFLITTLSSASAFEMHDHTCFGYGDNLCTLAKRESELGNTIHLSIAKSKINTNQMNYGLGLSLFTYEHNINAYFATLFELGAGAILRGSHFEGADAYFSLGVRVYPWREWFYMGSGLSLRGATFFDTSVATDAYWKNWTGQLYSYLEMGFTFPSKGVNLDMGVQLRQDLLYNVFGVSQFHSQNDVVGNSALVFVLGYRGLFGKFGAVPADETYDALQFLQNEGAYLTFSNIMFESESSELSDKTKLQLENLIRVAKNYNPTMIIVRAYGDVQDKNIRKQQKIANNRAQAVDEYLISQGVNKDKILAVGIPTKRATTQMLKERNQRVEIVLVK